MRVLVWKGHVHTLGKTLTTWQAARLGASLLLNAAVSLFCRRTDVFPPEREIDIRGLLPLRGICPMRDVLPLDEVRVMASPLPQANPKDWPIYE